MTRINLVDPSHLTDKHLLAEYKEITRPFNKVIKRIEAGTMDQVKIPKRYRLGSGHETFFFDKLEWLFIRYHHLYNELYKRGFNMDGYNFWKIRDNLAEKLVKTPYWNGYTPTPEEVYLNMSRLCRRSKIQSVLDELKATD